MKNQPIDGIIES